MVVDGVSSQVTKVWVPLLNVTAVTGAYMHNRGFWAEKAEVPFVEGFNEGIRKSKDVRNLLVVLGVGWGVMGIIGSRGD